MGPIVWAAATADASTGRSKKSLFIAIHYREIEPPLRPVRA
jgi:hypothetical protein